MASSGSSPGITALSSNGQRNRTDKSKSSRILVRKFSIVPDLVEFLNIDEPLHRPCLDPAAAFPDRCHRVRAADGSDGDILRAYRNSEQGEVWHPDLEDSRVTAAREFVKD